MQDILSDTLEVICHAIEKQNLLLTSPEAHDPTTRLQIADLTRLIDRKQQEVQALKWAIIELTPQTHDTQKPPESLSQNPQPADRCVHDPAVPDVQFIRQTAVSRDAQPHRNAVIHQTSVGFHRSPLDDLLPFKGCASSKDDNYSSVLTFLQRLDTLADQENMSPGERFQAMPRFLSGDAFRWYMNERTSFQNDYGRLQRNMVRRFQTQGEDPEKFLNSLSLTPDADIDTHNDVFTEMCRYVDHYMGKTFSDSDLSSKYLTTLPKWLSNTLTTVLGRDASLHMYKQRAKIAWLARQDDTNKNTALSSTPKSIISAVQTSHNTHKFSRPENTKNHIHQTPQYTHPAPADYSPSNPPAQLQKQDNWLHQLAAKIIQLEKTSAPRRREGYEFYPGLGEVPIVPPTGQQARGAPTARDAFPHQQRVWKCRLCQMDNHTTDNCTMIPSLHARGICGQKARREARGPPGPDQNNRGPKRFRGEINTILVPGHYIPDTVNVLIDSTAVHPSQHAPCHHLPIQIKHKLPMLHVHINDVPATVLLDTGAAVSLIDSQWLAAHPQLATASVTPATCHIKTASDASMPCLGRITASLQFSRTHVVDWHFVITSSLVFPIILGHDFLSTHQASLNFSAQCVAIPIPQNTQQDDGEYFARRAYLPSHCHPDRNC